MTNLEKALAYLRARPYQKTRYESVARAIGLGPETTDAILVELNNKGKIRHVGRGLYRYEEDGQARTKLNYSLQKKLKKGPSRVNYFVGIARITPERNSDKSFKLGGRVKFSFAGPFLKDHLGWKSGDRINLNYDFEHYLIVLKIADEIEFARKVHFRNGRSSNYNVTYQQNDWAGWPPFGKLKGVPDEDVYTDIDEKGNMYVLLGLRSFRGFEEERKELHNKRKEDIEAKRKALNN